MRERDRKRERELRGEEIKEKMTHQKLGFIVNYVLFFDAGNLHYGAYLVMAFSNLEVNQEIRLYSYLLFAYKSFLNLSE